MAATSSASLPSLTPSTLPQGLALSISKVLDGPQPGAVSSTSTSTKSKFSSASQTLTQRLAQHFATPESLSQESLDSHQAHLRRRLAEIDIEVDTLMQQLDSNLHRSSLGESSNSQTSLHHLLGQLSAIREKAADSESTVREITGDIRSLDTAKKNLVGSITALRRLQMLETGTDRLEKLTEEGNLREAAQALQAAKELQTFFKSFMSVERVAAMWRRIAESQQRLKMAAMEQYEKFFLEGTGTSPIRDTSVPDAALALDAIGSEAIASLLDWYCSLQLREYRRIFRATDEAGQLDNVSRRFAWFRRVMKQHDEEHSGGFLHHWHASHALVGRFSDITRDDVKSVLIRERAKLQVGTLLEALQSTMDYEQQASKRFHVPFADLLAANPKPISAGSSGPTGINIVTSTQNASTSISSVFEPYLGLFVEAQDKSLADLMAAFRRQGATVPDQSQQEEGTGPSAPSAQHYTVLPSSTELFYFYRQSLEQCSRFTNRESFRDLCLVFRRYLRAYADEVLRATLSSRPELSNRRSTSTDTRNSTQESTKWCLVLNTADYCANTCRQLEQRLKDKIHADFKEDLTLEPNRELFASIVSAAIQMLIREVEFVVEPALQRMLRPTGGGPGAVPWSQMEEVQGKSAYVDDLHAAIESIAVVVRQDIESKRYVRTWCDRVVAVLILKFVHCIFRLKSITRVMAEQLIIDLYEIKTILAELPQYTPSESSSALGSSYVRHVERNTQRVESLLRAVLAPLGPDAGTVASSREAFIKEYIQLVGDRSLSNFQKVLELKGLVGRRSSAHQSQQQELFNALVDDFMEFTQDLGPEEAGEGSFLTALDTESNLMTITPAPSVDFTAYDAQMTSVSGGVAGVASGTNTSPWLGCSVRSPDRPGSRSSPVEEHSGGVLSSSLAGLTATGLGLGLGGTGNTGSGGGGSATGTGAGGASTGASTPTLGGSMGGGGRVFGAGGKFGSLFGGLGMRRDENRSR